MDKNKRKKKDGAKEKKYPMVLVGRSLVSREETVIDVPKEEPTVIYLNSPPLGLGRPRPQGTLADISGESLLLWRYEMRENAYADQFGKTHRGAVIIDHRKVEVRACLGHHCLLPHHDDGMDGYYVWCPSTDEHFVCDEWGREPHERIWRSDEEPELEYYDAIACMKVNDHPGGIAFVDLQEPYQRWDERTQRMEPPKDPHAKGQPFRVSGMGTCSRHGHHFGTCRECYPIRPK